MYKTLEKQHNVWTIQEQLSSSQTQKLLDFNLKVLRDQYINQLIIENSMVQSPKNLKKSKKCSIL